MPGIFGVIDSAPVKSVRHRRELIGIVDTMSMAMRYEPLYEETRFTFDALGAYVGRVGFQQASEQPNDGTTDTVRTLTTGDHAGDATHIYERFGERGLMRLCGISAGFIADQTQRRCVLFTDRYGRERLFVHRHGSRTLFSSEAKAILAAAPETRSFDLEGLAEWIACGCTLGQQSLFRNIHICEAGTALVVDASGLTRHRYFDQAEFEQLEPVSEGEFLDGLSASLQTAVNTAARTAPRVAISLTGGLDSRMIMASLDATAGTVPCYTFGSMYRTTADVAVGKQVASRCDQPHQVVALDTPFLLDIRGNLNHAVYVSDGYLGLSGAAELYLNRQARSIAPARITGNWGGELMRGVRAFKYEMPKGQFIDDSLTTAISRSAGAFFKTNTHPLSAALFHQIPLQGFGRHAIERSQLSIRTPFLADDVVKWLYRQPESLRGSLLSATTVIGRRPHLLRIPTDRGLLGRGPVFGRRLSRRALIKAEYLTSHGAPDCLVKLAARLPQSMLETRFLGVDKFQHFRFWIRRELTAFVRDTLAPDATGDLRTLLDMRKVARMVDDHIAGRANFTNEIDKVLTLAVAQRTLFRDIQAS